MIITSVKVPPSTDFVYVKIFDTGLNAYVDVKFLLSWSIPVIVLFKSVVVHIGYDSQLKGISKLLARLVIGTENVS